MCGKFWTLEADNPGFNIQKPTTYETSISLWYFSQSGNILERYVMIIQGDNLYEAPPPFLDNSSEVCPVTTEIIHLRDGCSQSPGLEDTWEGMYLLGQNSWKNLSLCMVTTRQKLGTTTPPHVFIPRNSRKWPRIKSSSWYMALHLTDAQSFTLVELKWECCVRGEVRPQVKMQDRNEAETGAICPELTSRAMSMCYLAKGEDVEAGESQGWHQS